MVLMQLILGFLSFPNKFQIFFLKDVIWEDSSKKNLGIFLYPSMAIFWPQKAVDFEESVDLATLVETS